MYMLKNKLHRRYLSMGLLLMSAWMAGSAATAQEGHSHPGAPARSAPAPFVASNSKSFPVLMDDAMRVMDYGMANAPMNGDPDHDFAAMMVPHHQGAIDMAKTQLLYGKNPVLRRLAQEIIVTQGSEIALMQLTLKKLAADRPFKP